MDLSRIPQVVKKRPPEAMQELPTVPGAAGGDDTPRRIDLLAALPNVVLAAIYGITLHYGAVVPFLTPKWLGTMMAVEFIVIHSFGFVMVFALLNGAATHRIARNVFKAVFWGLLALYYFAAFKLGGLAGMAAFTGLAATTYLGFFFQPSEMRFGQLMIRWLFNFLIFLAAAYLAGMPRAVERWYQAREALTFGMLNFAFLALLEGSGLYRSEGMRQVMEQFKRGKVANKG